MLTPPMFRFRAAVATTVVVLWLLTLVVVMVAALRNRGPLVAWASDGGLKIMDVDKGKGGERISYVDK